MHRTHLLLVVVATICSLDGSTSASAQSNPPNVVVILSDDQGWGDLSLHGNPNLRTPNIDAMARDGAEIDHFYVCAVCSPTRAEFLTGRYHTRMGVYSTSTGGERFNADEQTIAEVFQQAGYATAAFGKWHSGMQYPYHPNARGFVEYYGFCSGHWGNYFDPMLEHNGEIVQGNGFIIDDLTNRAIDFIDNHRDQPFFVYLPLNTPHSPMQVPDPYWDRFADKEIVPDPAPANAQAQKLMHTRAALAMCENIDDNVGRLIQYLEERGIADNTIVIYFSDNGPNGARFNGGMRGRKGSTFEGGLRSPCLVRYPREIAGGTKLTKVAGAIDLLPTLVELTGIDHEPRKPLDGISIAPLLRGRADELPERLLFSAWNQKASVRSERFRMQVDGSLYEIAVDPGETIDVRGKYPDVAARLGAALEQWITETQPASSRSPRRRPITLGHPQERQTQLPARDAEPHGGVVRSNRFPNCTYMTQWTGAAEDRITWDIEVIEGGNFEVTMYYACPKESVGSELELSFGGQRLAATIEVPNDVPQIGREHDRVERQEGYVKDWRPMKLGVIQLEAGRGTLALRATKATGPEVAEMRLLLFRRVAPVQR
jgi:arylsulfatase A-like enzyme